MSNTHPDAERSRLRAIVASLDREISRLSRQVSADDRRKPRKRLLLSWEKLVKLLALGPEPQVRKCPVCNHVGMRAATRCGYCWTKLPLLMETEGVEHERD